MGRCLHRPSCVQYVQRWSPFLTHLKIWTVYRPEGYQKDKNDRYHRRVIIVLRSPSNPKREVAFAFGDYPGKLDRTHENRIRAEQLLLLSKHPPCPPKKLSSIPPSNPTTSSKWAEPGWHVDLEVPRKTKSNVHNFLPVPPTNKVFNSLHSEICSGTGHQMTSLVDTKHLRSLVIEGWEEYYALSNLQQFLIPYHWLLTLLLLAKSGTWKHWSIVSWWRRNYGFLQHCASHRSAQRKYNEEKKENTTERSCEQWFQAKDEFILMSTYV